MKRFAKYFFIGLLATISIALLYAYVAYPVEYVNRVLRWGDPGVDDYLKFPERLLEPSGFPFEFSLKLDEDHIGT